MKCLLLLLLLLLRRRRRRQGCCLKWQRGPFRPNSPNLLRRQEYCRRLQALNPPRAKQKRAWRESFEPQGHTKLRWSGNFAQAENQEVLEVGQSRRNYLIAKKLFVAGAV